MAQHFLIVFDGATASMKEKIRVFSRPAAAVEAYAEAERRYADDAQVQVVLIASDSLETVKATHPNFWNSGDFAVLARNALKRAAG